MTRPQNYYLSKVFHIKELPSVVFSTYYNLTDKMITVKVGDDAVGRILMANGALLKEEVIIIIND